MISYQIADVLVPLDGSTDADRAIPVAARLAARAGARVHLAAVFKPIVIGPELGSFDAGLSAADLDEITRAELTAHLDRCAEDVEMLFSVPARWEILEGEGSVSQQLSGYTRRHGIDLVVMQSHRRSTLGRLCLGSIGAGLLDGTETPCLLLAHRVADNEASSARRAPFRRILVPLDGSTEAESALPGALALASDGMSELLLLAVVPARWHVRSTPSSAPHSTSPLAAASTYLHRLVRQLAGMGVRARPLAIAGSSAAESIACTVRHERADLVCISAARRSQGDRLFFGSVIDTVLHGTDVPIMARRVEHVARVAASEREIAPWKELHGLTLSPFAQ